MNEGMLDAASVFGHYSPSYHIPKTALFGPEFQIYSASDAINRANFFYSLMYNPWPINPVLQPFVAVAGNRGGAGQRRRQRAALRPHDAVDAHGAAHRAAGDARQQRARAHGALPDRCRRSVRAEYLRPALSRSDASRGRT